MDDKGKTSDNGNEKPSVIPPEVSANPDVEDPRLYSPMQEADRPSPEQRTEQVAEPAAETEGDEPIADKAE